MTSHFFFGTLCHPPLLAAVIGETAHITLHAAQLPGYRIEAAREGPFPAITADPDAVTSGLRAEGLRPDDIEKLDYYEDAFGYYPTDVTLTDGSAARVYLPKAGAATPAGSWSLEVWEQTWGALSVEAAREVMGYHGTRPAAEVGAMFPRIRARAWSRINAAQSQHGAGTLTGQIEVSARRRVYADFFALDEIDLRHTRFNGSMGASMTRGVFIVSDAALVLPYDPMRDRVLLVEQMRVGPLARGDRACWQLEPVAGLIDPGETAEEAARREAVEEAGLTLGALHKVGETYASPGNSTEFYNTFVGIADLPDTAAGLGGLEDEQEDIRAHLMSFEALMELCDSGQAANTPLVMMAYWLARHRARLRGTS
ncbi:tellurite resistance protein [Roseobacter cerasinus]|uniref:ADP-ribose pyrophosphatase n=1 Tax=Roseobacter cerasinus TaxID=2602289 RepID=A0A640VR27_9RHOB|nr:NUDIX domain-containing protein [Roseobacter cerasinus]GFE50237.1 tellurite resistance protein [Roseobacter cerasinus]